MIDDPIHPTLRSSLVDFPFLPSGIQPVLRPRAGIKAVVFDFYDTLVITEARGIPRGVESAAILSEDLCRNLRGHGAVIPASATAMQASLAAGIAAAHARRKSTDPTLRQPEVEMRQIWRDALVAPSAPDDVLAPALARWEAWTTKSRLAAGARAMLAALRNRGLVLGIGSNAQAVSESLFSLHFGGSPESIGLTLNTWSWRLGVAKPDPRFFAAVADTAAARHLSPRQILFVGNDPVRDIAAAARAGMATCLYAGDKRCLRPAGTVTPDMVITCFSQLPWLLLSDPVD